MAEPKPFASLSSGLLARKGAAKPAMRPQGFGQMGVSLEDLGWNDMGQAVAYAPEIEEASDHSPSSIAALTPAPRAPVEVPAEEPVAPAVVEQQRVIEATFARAPRPAATPARTKAAASGPVSRERRAAGSKGKAAFTLRLDPDRHLKLRLACAVNHRSAQQIVTEALDDYLASIPELEALASRFPAKAGRSN